MVLYCWTSDLANQQLVFTKLASQLTAEKLLDLAIIPFIFLVQTLVSYVSSVAMARFFRFKKRQTNFVIAMGVGQHSSSGHVHADRADRFLAIPTPFLSPS